MAARSRLGVRCADHRAWRNGSDSEHVARLAEHATLLLKSRLVLNAERFVAEAKAYWLDRPKLVELEAQIAKCKPSESSNLEGLRRGPLARESEGRKLRCASRRRRVVS